jgi:hypothetical protein
MVDMFILFMNYLKLSAVSRQPSAVSRQFHKIAFINFALFTSEI